MEMKIEDRNMSRLDQLIEELCPKGVEYVKLNEVAQISVGGDLPKNHVKGQQKPSAQYPYPIYSNGVGNGALYGFADNYRIENEAVTISARGTIGYHEVRAGKFTPIVRLITMVADESKITTKFLNYALYIAGIEGVKTGIPSLTVPMLEKFTLPLPPLPVQEEIVRILDKFIALEVELEAELEAREKQYEFFRNILLKPADDSQTKKLKDVFIMKAGKSISATEISEISSREFSVPCYGGNGLRGFVKSNSHSGSHVLIGRQGALCGNVKRVSGDFYATEHAVVVTASSDVNVDWAFYILSSMNLNQYATKSAQPGLAVGTLEELEIQLPSFEVQTHIAAILDRFDSLVNDITQGLPAELAARRKQYEYYRDKLLTFKEKVS